MPNGIKIASPEEQLAYRRQLRESFGIQAPEVVTGPEVPEAPPGETPWYLKPLGWAARQPVLGTMMRGAGAILEPIERYVAQPITHTLAAPFTPPTPGTEGLPWLQRQKAEYEAWQAPRYAKGALEMLPWMIPVGGTAGLVGKSLGRYGGLLTKIAPKITAVETFPFSLPAVQRGIKAIIPTAEKAYGQAVTRITGVTPRLPITTITEKLSELTGKYLKPARSIEEHFRTEFTQDSKRAMAEWAAANPTMKKIIQLINKSAVADTDMDKLIFSHIQQRVEIDGLVSTATAHLRTPDRSLKKLFGIDSGHQLVPKAYVMPRQEGLPMGVGDILRNPQKYQLAPVQEAFIKEYHTVIDELTGWLDKLGIKYSKIWNFEEGGHYAPFSTRQRLMARDVRTGATRPIAEKGELLKGEELVTELKGRMIRKPQLHPSQEAGIKAGVLYDNPVEGLERYLREWMGEIHTIELREYVDSMARAVGAKIYPVERIPLEIREKTLAAATIVRNLKYADRAVTNAAMKKQLAGGTWRALREKAPEVAAQLNDIVHISIPEIEKATTRISKDIWEAIKLTPKRFLEALEMTRLVRVGSKPLSKLTMAERNIRPSELISTLKRLRLSDEQSIKMVRELYDNVDNFRVAALAEQKVALKALQSDVRTQLGAAQAVLGTRTKPGGLLPEYLHAREIAALPEGWERQIRSGAFSGIYPAEIGDKLNQVFGVQANQLLQDAARLAAAPRTMMAAYDFGVTQLHLLPWMFRKPEVWAKAFKSQFEYFASPDNFWRYISANREIVQEMNRYGIRVAGMPAEFVEALGKGGILERAGRFTQLSRFESSFSGALATAQVEGWKSLRMLAKLPDGTFNPKGLSEVAAWIRSITGTLDSRLLGIPAGQRNAEALMVFFAPRYSRALFAVATKALGGGLMQGEALKTLASLAAGSTALYMAICAMAGQEPKLDLSKGDALTIKVGGTNVGFGSGYMALGRLIANLIDAGITEPSRFLKVNPLSPETWRDQPLAKFFRSRTSVLTGTVIDTLVGRTYIGEPLDSVPDWLREEVLGQMTPFWLNSYLTDSPRPGLFSLPAEIFGMRAWAKTFYQTRDELQEKYAKQDYGGSSWGELTWVQRRELEEAHPDLVEITEKASERTAEYGGADRQAYRSWRIATEEIDEESAGALWKLSRAVDDGKITARQFRELSSDVYDDARVRRDALLGSEQYKTVKEFFDKPVDKTDMQLEDIAYSEYMGLINGSHIYDEYGLYNYDMAQQYKLSIQDRYGSKIWQYIEDRIALGRDEPPIMQLLRKARELLRPYWDIQDAVLAQLKVPEDLYRQYQQASGLDKRKLLWQNPLLRRAESMITQQRQMMRRQNPEVDKYLRLFY